MVIVNNTTMPGFYGIGEPSNYVEVSKVMVLLIRRINPNYDAGQHGTIWYASVGRRASSDFSLNIVDYCNLCRGKVSERDSSYYLRMYSHAMDHIKEHNLESYL